MSVGNLKEDFDKSILILLGKKTCKVVDVILNPKIATEMKNEKTFLATVMNIFEYYFNEKHKILIKGSNKIKLKQFFRNENSQNKLQGKEHGVLKSKRQKATKD